MSAGLDRKSARPKIILRKKIRKKTSTFDNPESNTSDNHASTAEPKASDSPDSIYDSKMSCDNPAFTDDFKKESNETLLKLKHDHPLATRYTLIFIL